MEYIHRKHPEKRLENWLKKNLNLFDPNLRLVGTQFQTSWVIDNTKFLMRFDIFAEDMAKEKYIIEVKCRANQYSVTSQLDYYIKKYYDLTGIKCIGILAALKFSTATLKEAEKNNIIVWDLSKKYGVKNGS